MVNASAAGYSRLSVGDPTVGFGGRAALHGLRLLCALIVMTNHWADGRYDLMVPQAQLAVDILLAVEGWLAADGLARHRGRSSLSLLIERWCEIYPLYMIALAFGAVAIASSSNPAVTLPPAALGRALLSGACLRPLFHQWNSAAAVFPLNWPSWAVVLELWGFVALCLLRRRMTAPVMLSIVAAGMAGLLAAAILWGDVNVGWRTEHYEFGFLRLGYDFFGGVLLRRFGQRIPQRVSPLWAWGLAIGSFFLGVRHVALPLLLIGTPAIVQLAAMSRAGSAVVAVGCFARRFALAVYLLHFPLLLLLRTASGALGLTKAGIGGPISYMIALDIVLLTSVTTAVLVAEPMGRRALALLRGSVTYWRGWSSHA